MKLVNVMLRESDLPLIASAIRNHSEHLIAHILNAAQLSMAQQNNAPSTVTIKSTPVKLSKNGKRIGRPPKGSK
ncbi:MAG: hypothetical protein RJA72_611 [Pseudomonadota bacterium]|jgi:hypothetical protein